MYGMTKGYLHVNQILFTKFVEKIFLRNVMIKIDSLLWVKMLNFRRQKGLRF